LIAANSVKYGIDWKIPVAIFKQESNFNYKAVNFKSRDFGLGQINAINIEYYKIDLGKLLTEKDYAVEETIKLLAFLCNNGRDKGCYTKYHSYTPSQRKKYKNTLKKHFLAIEEVINEWRSNRDAESRKRSPCQESIFRGKNNGRDCLRNRSTPKNFVFLAKAG
jgi:hypothetical protein